jgi:protein TonB
MTYRPRWRKAIVISMIFHILFLCIAGWLAGRFAANVESEPYLELELLTDMGAEGPRSHDSSSTVEGAAQAAEYLTTTPVMKSTSSATLPVVPKAVAIADDLAVVAVEAVAASQSISDYEQENTASIVGTTGEANGSGDGKGTAGNHGGGTGAGTGAGSSGNNSGSRQIAPPRILSKVEPVYPEGARSAGLEGTVLVKMQILANGAPGEITVNRSSGHDSLDEAAIAAVRQWRFIPAKNQDSGISITCYTTMPVVFRLR